MTVPARTPLGASTGNRKWFLDVLTSTGPDVWTPLHGMTEFKPARDPNLEEDSDFDSEGFQSETKTAEKWAVEGKLSRKVKAAAPTVYDEGQEFLRDKAQGKMGPANSVVIRYYEMEQDGPRIEAFQGRGAVSWSPEGGDMKALDMVSFKITGQGPLEAITHPDAGDSIPLILSLVPDTGDELGGNLIAVNGQNFVGVTGVEFAGVSIGTAGDDWHVVSSTLIVVKVPAGTGVDPVTVISAAGESAGVNYTFT